MHLISIVAWMNPNIRSPNHTHIPFFLVGCSEPDGGLCFATTAAAEWDLLYFRLSFKVFSSEGPLFLSAVSEEGGLHSCDVYSCLCRCCLLSQAIGRLGSNILGLTLVGCSADEQHRSPACDCVFPAVVRLGLGLDVSVFWPGLCSRNLSSLPVDVYFAVQV